MDNKNKESFTSIAMYILALTEATYRFARGLPPIDLSCPSVAEIMSMKNLAFIDDEEEKVTLEEAHEIFLKGIKEFGWTLGPEDFIMKTHPDIVTFDQLSKEAKDKYEYSSILIPSIRGFYQSIRVEFESEIMDSLSNSIISAVKKSSWN